MSSYADQTGLSKAKKSAFAPVDIASIVSFRIVFGLLIVWTVERLWSYQLISRWWIDAPFQFKYPGFSWVNAWPGNGIYIHWILLGIFALFVAAGFLYRVSAILLFLSYTYFFLLDQGRYVNHTYLICLFSFLLVFMPVHRAFSIDAWLRPRLRSQTVPAWTVWVLRAQMACVYFFAGIAKIAPDWFHGEPMRTWLKINIHFPVFDRFLHQEWAVYSASYLSLIVDLFVVPFLLWRRTRIVAFCVAAAFHLLNNQIFPLDIFPWLAIAATTLFLSPSWPRRLVSFLSRQPSMTPRVEVEPPSLGKQKLILGFVAVYIAIQILVPLRHFLHRGGIEWTYMEHRFSWQMMLERPMTYPFFYVTDPNTGREIQIPAERYLDVPQLFHMGWRPDMVWQFAHFLGTTLPQRGSRPLQVQVRMLVSINGRKPRLFLDPTVDLMAASRPRGRPPWLLEIHEPLPSPGQDFSRDPFGGAFNGEN